MPDKNATRHWYTRNDGVINHCWDNPKWLSNIGSSVWHVYRLDAGTTALLRPLFGSELAGVYLHDSQEPPAKMPDAIEWGARDLLLDFGNRVVRLSNSEWADMALVDFKDDAARANVEGPAGDAPRAKRGDRTKGRKAKGK